MPVVEGKISGWPDNYGPGYGIINEDGSVIWYWTNLDWGKNGLHGTFSADCNTITWTINGAQWNKVGK